MIANSWEEDGLIIGAISKSGVEGRISSYGIEYVEELLEDGFNSKETDFICEKLDDLLERIGKLELGQQIICDDLFEEIQELKEMLSSMSGESGDTDPPFPLLSQTCDNPWRPLQNKNTCKNCEVEKDRDRI